MAFIKDSERAKLIKKTEQKYGPRKAIITIELFLLLAFIALVITSVYFVTVKGEIESVWAWFKEGKLSPMGIGMLVLASVVVALGITSLILTWTLKSPAQIKASINKLNSSALSGKRVKGKKAVEVTRSRTTIQKKEEE